MRLELTIQQAAKLTAHSKPGFTMLGKIEREAFSGSNAETAGRLLLEVGNVPTASLPALREAIRTATTTTKPKRKTRR